MDNRFLGEHWLVELDGCAYSSLNSRTEVEERMLAAAHYAKATIVESVFHTFNPHGVSGVVVIAESHITIHTWPEIGHASADVFTCGNEAVPGKATEFLVQWLQPTAHSVMRLRRGLLVEGGTTARPVIEVVDDSGDG